MNFRLVFKRVSTASWVLALMAHSINSVSTANDPAGAHYSTIAHDGIERRYLLRVPASLRGNSSVVPLVIVLHGGGGNARNAENMTGFTAKAAREGFIVAYPEGTGRNKGKLLTWNAGHCCGPAMENEVDDVGFISAMIDHVSARYTIDPDRIYATGMSNGGMMAHRLGMELAGRLAAIAPVVATLFGDEVVPRSGVSALMINGMRDESVPFRGGATGGHFPDAWDGTPMQPALYQATFWADVDKCPPPARIERNSGYILRAYECPAQRAVQLYLIKNEGHSWPGGRAGSILGDSPGTALNATDVIWDFFQQHPRGW